MTRPRRTQLYERPHERLGARVVLDDGVDVDGCEMGTTRRLSALVHAEHAPRSSVHITHEGVRQGGPSMTDYEDVVGLLECNTLLDHQAADPSPAMITEIPVELLDPRFSREDQCDLGLAHRFAAPVARPSVTDPVSSADAIRPRASASTA